MSSTFEREAVGELAVDDLGFDDLTHQENLLNERSRQLLMSALEPYPRVPFGYLRRTTGLSDGNISGHLTKLEDAGLVAIEKKFEGKRPKTLVALTEEGRAAIDDYWRSMERFIEKRKRRVKLR